MSAINFYSANGHYADMAYYHFDEFITDSKRKYPHDLVLTLVLDTTQ